MREIKGLHDDNLRPLLLTHDDDLPPRCEVRRSMLRGELGRMLHSGQIIRDQYTAKYHISDEVSLF